MAGSRGFWETSAGILTALAGVVTAVTGLLVALQQLGVLGEARPRETAADPPREEREEGVAAPEVARSALVEERGPPPAAPEPAPPLPDLSGYWRDATGTVYEIVHLGGNRFRFTALNSYSGYAAQGEGVLEAGLRFRNEFRTNLPSTGSGSGTVSADGRRIEGSYLDSVLGSYPLVIYR